MKTHLLQINQVTGQRYKKETIKNISLFLEKGKSLVILGPNGAGKTTLLRTIMGLEKISCGTIHFFDTEIQDTKTRERAALGIGFCPEGRRLFPGLTVWETLAVSFSGKKVERIKRIDEIFALLPVLEAKQTAHAWSLSGGQQQMLAIARAIINKPKLILLDEPTLGLSPMIIDEVIEIIKNIKLEGVSIIMAEQKIQPSLTVGDTVAIFSKGSIIYEGLTGDIDPDQIVSMVMSGEYEQPF